MAKQIDYHEIWQKYQKSKTYMDGKGILPNTERNWNFYIGKQWESLKDSEGLEDLPMLNFIKQTVKYKVSTIAQHAVSVVFSDLNGQYSDACERLNKLADISWERGKMNRVAWKALNHCAVAGDSYVYWYDGDTRKQPQLIHNTNMHLGDENTTNLQDQPYIIVEERLDKQVVRERARLQGCSKRDIDLIIPDADMEEVLLNKEEVSNKVTSLLYMEKIDGIVHVARATKNLCYEKLHPIQQTRGGEYEGYGLTMYPIVPMVWEEVPNDARGTSEVAQLIPNQLELNKTLARRAISVKMTAFPRIAYDESALSNPEDLDKVGAVLKLNGGNAQAIGTMISYLAPQAMSQDAKLLSDELLQQTKDLAGASDTALGNIDLSRVSGSAATTVRDQQQVPLNEQVAMYQEFVENVALLYFELWKVYYPDGIEMDGIRVEAEEIQNIQPNVRIDIAEDTTLSRMATSQELGNLFNNNKITFREYAEAYPEHSSIPKDILVKIANDRDMQMQQQMATQPMMPDANGMIPDAPIDNMVESGIEGVAANGLPAQEIQAQLAR